MAAIFSLIGIPTAFLATMIVLLAAGGVMSPVLAIVLVGTLAFVFTLMFRYARAAEHASEASLHRRA